MGRRVRFGCVARGPLASRAAWRERVRRIDGWGYDTLLTPDHLGTWPPFAPLLAAADVSERLRVGTQVLNIELWNPLLLAREAAAVDVLTDGRLELGFGAGHAEEEFRAAGVPYPPASQRVDHLIDFVPLVGRLLAGDEVTTTAPYLLDHATTGVPTAQARVPIMVGGNGDRVLRLAGRVADIVSLVGFTSGTGQTHSDLSHFTWDGLADRVALVRSAASGRAADIELSILVQAVRVTDDRAGFASTLARAFEQPDEVMLDSPLVLIGSVAEIGDEIARLRDDLGVTYVTTFEPAAGDLAPVIDRVR